jgi:hypothetical protein
MAGYPGLATQIQLLLHTIENLDFVELSHVTDAIAEADIW